MGHVSNNAKREQGLLARLLLDQEKVTARLKALALGPGQSFWCSLHHSLPSLWCTLQLFADHIPTLLSLLSLDSPFSPFFNVFCPPFCCFQVVVTGSRQQPPALSSAFLHHPFSFNWPLNPLFFAAQQLGHLWLSHTLTPGHPSPRAVQADSPSSILPWFCWQSGIWLLFHP